MPGGPHAHPSDQPEEPQHRTHDGGMPAHDREDRAADADREADRRDERADRRDDQASRVDAGARRREAELARHAIRLAQELARQGRRDAGRWADALTAVEDARRTVEAHDDEHNLAVLHDAEVRLETQTKTLFQSGLDRDQIGRELRQLADGLYSASRDRRDAAADRDAALSDRHAAYADRDRARSDRQQAAIERSRDAGVPEDGGI